MERENQKTKAEPRFREIKPKSSSDRQSSSASTTTTSTQRSAMYKLRKWQIRANVQDRRSILRALPGAFSELDRLAIVLELDEEKRDVASRIIREMWQKGIVRGRSMVAMIGAAVYAACRISGDSRRLSDVAGPLGVTTKNLARCYRLLASNTEENIPLPDPLRLVSHILKKIGGTEDLGEKAMAILSLAKENELITGRDPWGLAAAALYIASFSCGFRVTQITLAHAAGVTEVTVRNRYKEIIVTLGIELTSQN